jgi:hypothetical protein
MLHHEYFYIHYINQRFHFIKYNSLKVSAPECHSRGVYIWNASQHTNLGNDQPRVYHYSIEILEYTKVTSINLQYCDTKTGDQINLGRCLYA